MASTEWKPADNPQDAALTAREARDLAVRLRPVLSKLAQQPRTGRRRDLDWLPAVEQLAVDSQYFASWWLPRLEGKSAQSWPSWSADGFADWVKRLDAQRRRTLDMVSGTTPVSSVASVTAIADPATAGEPAPEPPRTIHVAPFPEVPADEPEFPEAPLGSRETPAPEMPAEELDFPEPPRNIRATDRPVEEFDFPEPPRNIRVADRPVEEFDFPEPPRNVRVTSAPEIPVDEFEFPEPPQNIRAADRPIEEFDFQEKLQNIRAASAAPEIPVDELGLPLPPRTAYDDEDDFGFPAPQTDDWDTVADPIPDHPVAEPFAMSVAPIPDRPAPSRPRSMLDREPPRRPVPQPFVPVTPVPVPEATVPEPEEEFEEPERPIAPPSPLPGGILLRPIADERPPADVGRVVRYALTAALFLGGCILVGFAVMHKSPSSDAASSSRPPGPVPATGTSPSPDASTSDAAANPGPATSSPVTATSTAPTTAAPTSSKPSTQPLTQPTTAPTFQIQSGSGGTRVTSLSVNSMSPDQSGSSTYVAQVHVSTSGTGSVTLQLVFAGSSTSGEPGSVAPQSMTVHLSGRTSYDVSEPVDGNSFCPAPYVGVRASAGGSSSYQDTAATC